MRLLPHAARPVISRLLEVDPKKRATMEEILEDEWIKEIQCCTVKPVSKSTDATLDFIEDEDEVLVKGVPPHEHTIVKEG